MNFVTGSTGLVGGYLILELLRRGEKVMALRRSSSSTDVLKKIFKVYEKERWQDLLDQIKWIDGDVMDYSSLEDAMIGVKDVYHSAGFVSYQPKDKAKLYEINQGGTRNMVNAALAQNVRKFCYVSSIAALGAPRNESEQHTEDDFLQSGDNNTQYGFSKFYGEQEVWRASEEGLNVVIVNPSVILGFGNPAKGSTKLFTKLYEGLKFYTPGSTGIVDVRDVVETMIQLTKSEDTSQQRYILNGSNTSFKHLFELIAETYQIKPPAIKATPFMSEVYWRLEAVKSFLTGEQALVTKETARAGQRNSFYSNDKVRKALDYSFIPLEETVAHFAALIKKDLS